MLKVRRLTVGVGCLAIAIALCSTNENTFAAGARTQNFIVQAPNQQLAQEVGNAAEHYRKELAIQWLGAELPRWGQPCPIMVLDYAPPRDLTRVPENRQVPACGATSFSFNSYGVPQKWSMEINGEHARLLDAVLPHEVLHTVFATHYGRPLPRWADEGACTTVEHASERAKHEANLFYFLDNKYGIPFAKMVRTMDYPQGPDQDKRMLALYAQGYSVAKFLISQGGKRKYVDFVAAGLQSNNWAAAAKQYYGFETLGHLQMAWNEDVRTEYVAFDQRRRGLPVDNGGAVAMVADASANPRYGSPASGYGATGSGYGAPAQDASGYAASVNASAGNAGQGYGAAPGYQAGGYQVGPSAGQQYGRITPPQGQQPPAYPSSTPGPGWSQPPVTTPGSIATMSGTTDGLGYGGSATTYGQSAYGQAGSVPGSLAPASNQFADASTGGHMDDRLPLPPGFDPSEGAGANAPRGNTPADLVARGHSVTTVTSESGQGGSLSWYAKERDQHMARVDQTGRAASPPMPVSEANRRVAEANGQGTATRRTNVTELDTEEPLHTPPSDIAPLPSAHPNSPATSSLLRAAGGANLTGDLHTNRAADYGNSSSRLAPLPVIR